MAERQEARTLPKRIWNGCGRCVSSVKEEKFDQCVFTGGSAGSASRWQPLHPSSSGAVSLPCVAVRTRVSTPPFAKHGRLHLVDFPIEKVVIARPRVDFCRANLTPEAA